jgi:uncharacterized protein (TIGR01777 family)
MKIIVSGAGGLIGSHLLPSLEAAGHDVTRLVRRPTEGGLGEVAWNPDAGDLDDSVLDGADAVINLNGRNIGEGRWRPAVKDELRSSRLNATTTIAAAIDRCESPPSKLINASAVGFYGDRGEEVLDESSPVGGGFLAELSQDWETAAKEAESARTRVVLLRLGMVVAREGALGRMLTPFKMGIGGPIGSGRQFWPWIAIEDVVGIVHFILENDDVAGPLNLVSPQEIRCTEFARTLGRVLGRPAVLPMPAFAARLALGEMAEALLLASARVRPQALEEAGYTFQTPSLAEAIRAALVKTL